MTAKKYIESLLLSQSVIVTISVATMYLLALINLVLAKVLQKVYVLIDLLIIVKNLWIGMKFHSDKTNLLKTILSTIVSVLILYQLEMITSLRHSMRMLIQILMAHDIVTFSRVTILNDLTKECKSFLERV